MFSLSDIEPLLGPVADEDRARAELLAEIAMAKLIQRVPRLTDRVISGELDSKLVIAALHGIVGRALENPLGASSVTASDGPFSHTVSFGERVWVSDSDISDLMPRRTRHGSSIGVGLRNWQVPR